MIVVLNIKKPYQVVFTENISINYNLGIQVIRKTLLVQKSKLIFTDCKAHLFFSLFLFTIKNNCKIKSQTKATNGYITFTLIVLSKNEQCTITL
jgi:hypothetical protein